MDGASEGKKCDAEKWIHKRREEEIKREVVGNGGPDPDAASLMIFLFCFSSSYVVSVISGSLKGGFIRLFPPHHTKANLTIGPGTTRLVQFIPPPLYQPQSPVGPLYCRVCFFSFATARKECGRP